jgi:hypothetical protein
MTSKLENSETSATESDIASVADLEALIAATIAEKAAAQKALAALVARRESLLVTGAADAEIETAELEITRRRRALQRFDIRAADLDEKARVLRAAQTEADFVAFYTKYRAADRAFRDGLREAYRRRLQLIALIDEGQRQFPGRVGAYVAVPTPDLTLDDWMIDCHERDAETALANESRRAMGEW